jgi:hypothetical protein
MELRFPNGSLLKCGYIDALSDTAQFQGTEWQVIMIDELGLLIPEALPILHETLRSSNAAIPVRWLRATANPGGPSHAYVRSHFIDPSLDGRKIITDEQGRTTRFIRSSVYDNVAHVGRKYVAILEGIEDPARRKSMLEGDFNAFFGQVFQEWDATRHIVGPRKDVHIPAEWRRFAGIDYGFSAPFAAIWLAIDNDGRAWAYREMYARGLSPAEQARHILEAEAKAGERGIVHFIDPSTAAQVPVEQYAAELAKIGGSPLAGNEGTTYALSTMLRAYGEKPTQGNAASMAALINAGVSAGDLHLSDLLAAESTGIFSTSRAYGISPQDTMGLLDFFTSQGVPANTAATRARMFLALTAAPSQQATGILNLLGMSTPVATGLESQLAALGMRPSKMAAELAQPNGIAGAMEMFAKAIGSLSPTDREALVSKIFGGGRSEATALTILQNPSLLTSFTNRVGTLSQPATFMSDWQKTQKTFSFQWSAFTSDISNLAVVIGGDVLPVLGGLLDVLGPMARFLANNKKAAEGLSAVLGLALVGEIVKVSTLVGGKLVDAIVGFGSTIDKAGTAAWSAIGKIGGLSTAENAEGIAATRAGTETAAADAEMGAAGAAMLAKLGIPIALLTFGGYKWMQAYNAEYKSGGGIGAKGTANALSWLKGLHPENSAQVAAIKKVVGEIGGGLVEEGSLGWAQDLAKVGIKPPDFGGPVSSSWGFLGGGSKDVNLTVNTMIDGKVVAAATIRHLQDKMARR